MRRTRRISSSCLPIVAAGALLVGCGGSTLPSRQLVDARSAYAAASVGNAARYAPSSLLDARRALDAAELESRDAPGSPREQHLAYIATRQAQIAAARGDAAADAQVLETAKAAETAMLEQQALSAEIAREEAERELRTEREERERLEQERNAALEAVREFAAIQETERGLVITLAGSLLFRTDEATLLPVAQQRLDQVAVALQRLSQGQSLVIEGHTDDRGTSDFNWRLSAARAEAVRGYLVQRGVRPEQMVAIAKGEDEPIASNATPEGRANNRRVEIVVSRPALPQAAQVP